ncbi:MAG: hypothetical protein ACI9HU_001887 [Colwellia sp.]
MEPINFRLLSSINKVEVTVTHLKYMKTGKKI